MTGGKKRIREKCSAGRQLFCSTWESGMTREYERCKRGKDADADVVSGEK